MTQARMARKRAILSCVMHEWRKKMLPSKTHKILGSRLHQAYRNSPGGMFAVSGNDINELRALAMRMGEPFTDPNEKRDWENRLHSMCDNAWKL